MKKLIIPALFLISTFCMSQSATEKYNSLYKRYDYFNSSGELIGYKKYNSLKRQWEYYEINGKNYERKPREYGDYIEIDTNAMVQAAIAQRRNAEIQAIYEAEIQRRNQQIRDENARKKREQDISLEPARKMLLDIRLEEKMKPANESYSFNAKIIDLNFDLSMKYEENVYKKKMDDFISRSDKNLKKNQKKYDKFKSELDKLKIEVENYIQTLLPSKSTIKW